MRTLLEPWCERRKRERENFSFDSATNKWVISSRREQMRRQLQAASISCPDESVWRHFGRESGCIRWRSRVCQEPGPKLSRIHRAVIVNNVKHTDTHAWTTHTGEMRLSGLHTNVEGIGIDDDASSLWRAYVLISCGDAKYRTWHPSRRGALHNGGYTANRYRRTMLW